MDKLIKNWREKNRDCIDFGLKVVPFWVIASFSMLMWAGNSSISKIELFFRFIIEKIIMGLFGTIMENIPLGNWGGEGAGLIIVPLLFIYLSIQGFIFGFLIRFIYKKLKNETQRILEK